MEGSLTMSVPSALLFRTVPEQDYLGFWPDGAFEPSRVVRFLELSKADVAKVAGVALASVRFDHKAPKDVLDRLIEMANVCGLVAEFFAGDSVKTALWFRTQNPLLGNISPRDMIRVGQHDRLRRFVMDALQENVPRGGEMQPHRGEASEHAPEEGGIVQSARNNLGPSPLAGHRAAIDELCRRYGVRRLALFGSMLRPDFDPAKSDVDLAVEFGPPLDRSPARQYFDFKSELEQLLGRPVDLIELTAMPDSRLRRIIERTQVPLYAEAA
jgi:predicted nucleotidyltransferase